MNEEFHLIPIQGKQATIGQVGTMPVTSWTSYGGTVDNDTYIHQGHIFFQIVDKSNGNLEMVLIKPQRLPKSILEQL